MHYNGEVHSLKDLTLPKLLIKSKNASNKSCPSFSFLQKTQRVHLFISSRSGARGLERLSCFKYNILKWDGAFTLGINTAKITDKIKKCFKWNMLIIQFPEKKVVGAYVYHPQEWIYGASKIETFEIIYCTETGKYIHFRAECCKQYALYQEKRPIKVVKH